jgi:hypothetical protein
MVVELESNRPRESVLGGERSLLGGRKIVARYRDRLSSTGQGVPDDGLVLVRDEKHPDGGLVLRSAQPILDQGDIEAELAGIARVELGGLELDDDVPKLFDVEEQQIDEEVIALDIEVDLTTDEREPGSELTQSVDDALDEPILEPALRGIAVDGEELECERILGDLLSKLGVGAFESVREVRWGRPLPRVQLVLIWWASTGRLQPWATSLALYHSRNSESSSLSSNSMTCPHGNWPTGRWPIASGSGHASANLRMYLRLAGEKPFTPGNSVRRSAESRDRTLLPQGAVFCRSMIVAPICQ